MENTKEKIKDLKEIDLALKNGAKLHGWRSGGGLRVISLELHDRNVGYGEHPDVLEALEHANEDLLAGGRKYSEVYGKIYPHYLTGSLDSTSELDRWILDGNDINAEESEGKIKVTLSGLKIFRTPKETTKKVRETQKELIWEARGFTFRTYPNNYEWDLPGAVGTEVISEGNGDKKPWSYRISKIGLGKSFILAVREALKADEIEIE